MNEEFQETLEKIASTPELILDITKEGSEYYFSFKGFLFSLLKRETAQNAKEYGKYTLYVYPKFKGNPKDLSELFSLGVADEIDVASYHESEAKAATDKQAFEALYKVITGKHLNLDALFKKILD